MSDRLDVGSISRGHKTYSNLAEIAIRDMVMSGRLALGERLNEVELAKALDISRGPLREAIQRLTSEGLLSMRSHHGASVRVFTWGELQDLYELRLGLEAFALRVAATRASHEQLDDLLEAAPLVVVANSVNEPSVMNSEFAFHRRLVALSGNDALIDMHAAVLQKIGLALGTPSVTDTWAAECSEAHRAAAIALRQGDAGLATQKLEGHLHEVTDYARVLLDKRLTRLDDARQGA